MTRSARVTVRLPGAKTAPATSTKMWFQTGVVKHGRKIASQDIRIVGTGGRATADSVGSDVIAAVESSRPRGASGDSRWHATPPRGTTYCAPDGRPDHSADRALPLLPRGNVRGAPQPRLHAL